VILAGFVEIVLKTDIVQDPQLVVKVRGNFFPPQPNTGLIKKSLFM
jgi:hypothetical protein